MDGLAPRVGGRVLSCESLRYCPVGLCFVCLAVLLLSLKPAREEPSYARRAVPPSLTVSPSSAAVGNGV